MKKQKITFGSVLEISLGNNLFNYAQILDGGCAFFNVFKKIKLEDLMSLMNSDILFIIRVYDDVIKNGDWVKIGNIPIREDLKVLPMKFIQDELDNEQFELYNPNTGEIQPAKRKDCIGLERAAVWEKEHVEDRLRDYFKGNTNSWVESMKIV